MYSSVILSTLSGLALVNAQSNTNPVTGILGNAQVVTNNPSGVAYTAQLNGTPVAGSVSGVATANGTGVQFTVQFSNLPTSGGPFLYHIHDQPVGADLNCNDTLGHLDPTQRGEMPPCDPTQPQTCQVGDLAGKYGKITSNPFTASYVDLYASTVNGIGAFFGNRSITLHWANTTRLTCANFQQGGSNSSGTSYSSGGYTNGTSGVTPFLGAASSTGVSLSALLTAFAFALLL